VPCVKAIGRVVVRPAVPAPLQALEELALNLRWAWHEPTRALFRAVSEQAWERSGDPWTVLNRTEPARLQQLAGDPDFVHRAELLREELRRYLSEPRWYQTLDAAPDSIAYFSPEFGIAAALPQYSGGLGILAGDHLKSASDLGLPLLAVGLFYRSGYFTQSISDDGWQQESYPRLDPAALPLTLLREQDGSTVLVRLALPGGRRLAARIWVVEVGRVRLLLLDADVSENDEELRRVTDSLYGGGSEHRLRQELLLGIGGVRALRHAERLLGVPRPRVFHTNEGHAGFQGVERLSELLREGLSFEEALVEVRAGTVFTTHTPVPAGIDRFERSLVERYFSSTELLPGVPLDRILALGSEAQLGGDPAMFNMAALNLRLAQRANGVAKLHGRVSRSMFAGLWPGFGAEEAPIISVTNGVHAPSWVDRRLSAFAEDRLGTPDTTRADWRSSAVTDAELWALRNELRAALVEDARRRARAAHEADGGIAPAWLDRVLDPEVLTLGFARRGASYKRPTLMLHDPERLRAILCDPQRPVQIVIAGKAHPADDEGKRLIQQLYRFAEDPEVRERMVFLPNYDIAMAQTLYPGTDVWLNNPLRPMEACGTSGMKAALNGSLNLSILDGWWDEYYDGQNGWAIPSAVHARDAGERDALEAGALYDLIEHRIAPLFYERDAEGIPSGWLRRVRHALATLSPELSADRMVKEYVTELYTPAAASVTELAQQAPAPARAFAAWKARVASAWPSVAVTRVETEVSASPEPGTAQVGDNLTVRAQLVLGTLSPEDVRVQLVCGPEEAGQGIAVQQRLDLEPETDASPPSAGVTAFRGALPLEQAGSFGYGVRVLPHHALLASEAELGLVASADPAVLAAPAD